jgi:hypothetical protein
VGTVFEVKLRSLKPKPATCIARLKPIRGTEKATQRAILDYLELNRVFHWRNNTGTFTSEYKDPKSFVWFGALGSPDIFAVLRHRPDCWHRGEAREGQAK